MDKLGNELPVNTTPLSQQGSIYPMTQDQTSLGHYGSMNLVQNIHNPEETQEGQLLRQASITQPSILSQTSSDDVWSQQNFGDITPEELLFRSDVGGSNNNGGYTHGLSSSIINSNTSLGYQFQISDLMNNMVPRSHQYENGSMSTYEPQQPIPNGYTYGTQGGFSSGFMGIGDQTINQNMTSLVPNVATILSGPMTTCSSSSTPIPILGKGIQKRKGKSLVLPSPSGGHSMNDVDKKLLRKIKNRESAARSTARKKAIEQEIKNELEDWKKKCQDLEKENELLKEMINRPEGRLRRTKSDIK